MGFFDGLLNIISPKGKPRTGGVAFTPTHQPEQASQVLTAPTFRGHLDDIFTTRQANDTRTLLKTLFRQDPDVSAAVNAYLTLANTDIIMWAETVDGAIDAEASADLQVLVKRLTRQVDYTLGFQFKQGIYQLASDLRYMLLLRGGISCELIFDKSQAPDSLRQIDVASLSFYEQKPGEYKPAQVQPGKTDPVKLDIPTFFLSFFRRDPTTIHPDSNFVSAINTIAARQQVINDLYRIMQQTGFPRIEIKVLEEILIKNAPPSVKLDATLLRTYIDTQVQTLANTFSTMRPDQAFVHTDSVEFGILNEKNPSAAIDISNIVETLNAQNQAGLKTMATILGRGSAGVNTGSVEARLAAMYADELNEPIAEMMEKIFSYCLHQQGFQGFANVRFRPAELRPDTELEPQRLLRANRLRQDLSDGIITDADYTLEMYGRLPYPDAPPLSGTGFMNPAPTGGGEGDGTDSASDVSPNSDPLGRSVSPDKTKMNKANQPKSSPPARTARPAR